MPTGQLVCPHCGLCPKTGRYVHQPVQTRYSGQKGAKPWFNFLGIDFTPIKTILAAALLLQVAGGAAWYVTGPGDDFKVDSVELVTLAVALDALDAPEPGSLLKGTIFTANPVAGVNMPPFAKPPPGTPATRGAPNANQGEVYIVTGPGKMLVTRQDAQGDYVLVRVRLSQRLMQQHKLEDGYDLQFREEAFALDVNGQKVPGMMLPTALANGTAINLDSAKTSDYRALLPPGVKPTKEDTSGFRDGMATGTIGFDGAPNASGQFGFTAVQSEYGHSINARGQVKVTQPGGISLDYQYDGGEVKINWNQEARGWRRAPRTTRKAELSPWTKFECWVLFPRPASNGQKIKLYLGAQHVATLAGQYAAAPTGMAAATAPPRQGGDGQQPRGYFAVLAAARRAGQGTVAASNMQQLLLAMNLYTQNNRGVLPAKLDDLRSEIDAFDALMHNPRTKANPGFIYLRPDEATLRTQSAHSIPILYESKNGQPDPDGAVGYLDGHIDVGKP